MRRLVRLALAGALTAGIVMPCLAQDNFPDVPDNHWAYEALARLKKDGILDGYPDGLFRGNRPASRYELAVAVDAAYVHLKSITDGLKMESDQLTELATGADVHKLMDAVSQLQGEINDLRLLGPDLEDLKKLAAQFEKELTSLGLDYEQLKVDLAVLSKRVGALEAHDLPFEIHGDASFYLLGGSSSGREIGIMTSGRAVGSKMVEVNGKPVITPTGLDQDSTIFHELTLKLTSNNDTGPKWHGDIVIGDLLGASNSASLTAPFPSQSHNGIRIPFGAGPEAVYVQDLAVDFDTSIAGQGLAAELGRTGYEIDPYIYKRPNVLPFTNDRWGDGKWYFDGGILGFHWCGVKLDVFGGEQDQETTSSGLLYQPMVVGAIGHPTSGGFPVGLNNSAEAAGISVDEDLGLNLGVPIGDNGKLNLAYIWFESNTASTVKSPVTGYSASNRADVYGGDLQYKFAGSGLKLNAGYSASDLDVGSHSFTTKDNYAWHASLAYDASRWGAEAGYRQIEPQFGAPGDWGRIGTWWNPTDIQGPWAGAHVKLNDQFTLKASGEWYTGTNTSFNLPTAYGGNLSTGLTNHDTIASYKTDLGYRLNEAWDFSVGFEYVPFGGGLTANAYESWYNFGIGYSLSDQARLSFLYQYSAADPKGIGTFDSGLATGKMAGNLITSQLTVKF